MSKLKKFFETPKKSLITLIALLVLVICTGTCTAFAASAVAESSSIGATTAQNFAFADAGIDPASVSDVETSFCFQQGQFVYEVEFTYDGTEYEYWIKASNGAIVKKELEILVLDTANTILGQITLEDAKSIALDDAQKTEDQVTFTEAKSDIENGISVYEIEFYCENIQYEYEINSQTGLIISKSTETIPQSDTTTVDNSSTDAQGETVADTTLDTPTSTAGSASSSSSSSGTASVGSSSSSSSSGTASTGSSSSSSQSTVTAFIGLDKAKSIALSDAGLSSSAVTYTQAKLDYENGVAVYEIEFYTSSHAYEYEINATTGKILEKDVETLKTASSGSSSSSTVSYISVDKAKSIAVNYAGFSISEVTFKKASLDQDDHEYEIEFYKDGVEYEVTLDAISGAVLEFEIN